MASAKNFPKALTRSQFSRRQDTPTRSLLNQRVSFPEPRSCVSAQEKKIGVSTSMEWSESREHPNVDEIGQQTGMTLFGEEPVVEAPESDEQVLEPKHKKRKRERSQELLQEWKYVAYSLFQLITLFFIKEMKHTFYVAHVKIGFQKVCVPQSA